MQQTPADLITLRRLRTLSQFSDEQLQSLASHLTVLTSDKKQLLIGIGCTEEFSLFILKGAIILTARDGKQKQHVFTEQEELNPVAQIRPSMYDVHAKDPVLYLRIDKKFLTEFANQTETDVEDFSVQVIEQDVEANPLTIHLFQDLMSDSVSLPSLPRVAQHIQQVFHDDNADANKVASILMTDPAITSKLIKIANSPVYQGVAPTETLQAAIIRLGMDTTYKQVMAYAVNELFRSHSSNISARMDQLWSHSRQVAAISRVLSKITGLFDPEQAMLAGLVHDLGIILIVEYLQKHCDQFSDPKKIGQTIQSLRPQITGMLMQRWNFSEDLIRVAEECEDWFRNSSDTADLCDLVMVAQYHSLMGTADMQSMPPINTIPAMTKLNMGPQESIKLIKQSRREINEIERMLH